MSRSITVTELTLAAQNTGTPWKPFIGNFNISISGGTTSTITLQRSFNGGVTAVDIKEYTADIEESAAEPESGVLYRLFCKTGDYIDGASLRLSQ